MKNSAQKLSARSLIRLFDVPIIILSLALVVLSAYLAYMKPQKRLNVHIRAQNDEWIFPIGADETIAARGPLGDTIIRIYEKSAWVVSSPCENQSCVASGHIHKQGGWAACLPNNVILLIEGTDDDEVDVVAW